MIVEDDELDDVLEEAKAFISFLAESGLLDHASDPPEHLVEHLSRIDKQFRANMADPGRQSFGKRLWSQALGEGVSLDDEAAVAAFIDRFNARPRAERDAVLKQHLSARQPTGRVTAPGTRPRPPSGKRRKRRR